MPWPMTASLVPQTWNEYFLRLIALRDPWTYAALKASYHVMLFTTPYIGYSFLLSALYIFALRTTRRINPQPLPPYPAIQERNELYVVIGEIHHPRRFIPAENPYWLTIPARGLFTGTIIIGATGAGKTACSMYPCTEQLLGFKAEQFRRTVERDHPRSQRRLLRQSANNSERTTGANRTTLRSA